MNVGLIGIIIEWITGEVVLNESANRERKTRL
jgi:hypothetical protein